MLGKCKPIPYQEFPITQEIVDKTNCLAFALGINRAKRKNGEFNLEKTEEPIEKVFLKKVKELGFNPRQFKKISKEHEEKTKGYIIRIYGFEKEIGEDQKVYYDFHLIRRELDGQWVHKPGFFYQARPVTKEDWLAIFRKFGVSYISFVLDA